MHKRTIESLVVASFLFVCSNHEALAATAFTSAISQGDVGSIIKRPADQVAFEAYVAACKAGVEVDAIPQLDCNDINFRNPDGNPDFSNSTDYVTHTKINSVVDAVFACRWVHPSEGVNEIVPTGALVGASGEMIVHNKATGNTCFFKMKPGNLTTTIEGANASTYERIATTSPSSPTDADGFAFWDTPSKVLAEACTQCHAAGPWIASPQIVGSLAQFGLINDGHDIKNKRYAAIGSNGAKLNQYAADSVSVGATQIAGRCASSCHSVAGYGLRGDDINTINSTTNTGFIIIPSISRVIDDVRQGGHMPPTDPYSDYRWINRDDPRYLGDYERLSDIQVEYPQFYCSNPISVQAHEADSTIILATDDLPNVFNTFNLLDGLICLNADQSKGKKCSNYETRYKCSGRWTAWNSSDTPGATGDFERRSKFPGLCANPTSMQARVVSTTVRAYAPRDRLATFNTDGLICNNADQPSGHCSDYAVRFICAQ